MLADPTRPGVPVLVFHAPEGPVFWPLSEIADLREEWEGRVEATHRDGRVAHRPGPLEPTPLLPEVPPDADVVLGWAASAWITLAGERPGPAKKAEALRLCPALVPAGDHLVHPGAVRALRRDGMRWLLTLEGGRVLAAGSRSLTALAAAAGLSWPDPLADLSPRHRFVYERGLRDWPTPLLLQGREVLRERYGQDPLLLVDHVIWEAFRAGQSSDSARGLFYNPLKILASHAGLLTGGGDVDLHDLPPAQLRLFDATFAAEPGPWTVQRLWETLQARLDLFVGEARILTFRQLRFRDQFAAYRRIGGRRPRVILLVEKDSLDRDARILAEMFDVTLVLTSGFPKWISTEFLVEALGPGGPVLVVAFCDFDVYGWMIPEVFQRMLERYGVETSGILRLVKPERFTPEEIALLADPLPVHPGNRKLVERWIAETGGIGGQALGLYADYLRPIARLVLAFREETGLEPVAA